MKSLLARGALAIATGTLAIPLLVGPVFAASPSAPPAPTGESTTATKANPEFEVVAGNFGKRARAEALKDRLASQGFEGFIVENETRNGKSWYQVEKSFEHRDVAHDQAQQLHAAHHRAWIEVDEG